jgi:hypothetical protein
VKLLVVKRLQFPAKDWELLAAALARDSEVAGMAEVC